MKGRRRIGGMENLFDKYPRDLLQRFMAGSNRPKEEQDDDEEEEEEVAEEIELNLGLSLGGRFGVDKHSNKLIRSTSVASSIPLIREDDDATNLTPASYPTLTRTSSLPTETEEEWRKRKELQTLRRMEAKRRRSEKQKSSNPLKTDKEGGSGGGSTEDVRRELEGSAGVNMRENQYIMAAAAAAAAASNRFGASVVGAPFGLPSWAAAATRQAFLGGGIDSTAKGKGSFLGGGLPGYGQPHSQGSVESQGGSSSGISDFESKQVHGGSSSGGEARSPASNQSLQERSNQETMGSSGAKASENTCITLGAVENPAKGPDLPESRGKETGMSAMEDMPCVFTKGDGPNGRRIDGILYKYGKGEEVRIMCVCHGSFLSPAEFVKHAGGGDVAHPLRHIVVNPSSNSL